MNILRPVLKTKQGYQFVVVMTDCYLQLTKEISTSKTNDVTVACIFQEHCVANYGILSQTPTEHGPQFPSKLFVALCTSSRVNNVSITKYNSQINVWAEYFNSTLILRLYQYVPDHQTEGHTYLVSLNYGYNIQILRSIRITSFSVALTVNLPGPVHRATKTRQRSFRR